jgi:hypothetical protein
MGYLLLKGEGVGLNPEGEDSINQGLCQINYGGNNALRQIYRNNGLCIL